jgi:hypothetical protein
MMKSPLEVVKEAHRRADANEWEQSLSACRAIEDANDRGEALAYLATRLRLQGLLAQSKRVLSEIENDSRHQGAMAEKAIALSFMPRAYLQRGDLALAADSIHEAAQMADFIGKIDLEPYYSADILLELAKVARDLGELEWTRNLLTGAAESALRSVDHIDCQKVLAAIGIAFAEIGDREVAKRLAFSLKVEWLRERRVSRFLLKSRRQVELMRLSIPSTLQQD